MVKLTYAQAEVVAAIYADGGWRDGFHKHDVFQNRDNLDNARRRTLSRLIANGVAVSTGYEDMEGNPEYVFPTDIVRQAHQVLNQ